MIRPSGLCSRGSANSHCRALNLKKCFEILKTTEAWDSSFITTEQELAGFTNCMLSSFLLKQIVAGGD